MILLSTEMLVADYIMTREKLSYSNLSHIFTACNMAILINNNTDFPLEGYDKYLEATASQLGVKLIKSPVVRQMNIEYKQELQDEINRLDVAYLDNWISFCSFISNGFPKLWSSAYNFTLKDVVLPREFIELEKLKMNTKYTFPNVKFNDSVALSVKEVLTSDESLYNISLDVFNDINTRFVALGYIIEGLKAYSSVGAMDFVPLLIDRALFIPRILSHVDLL